MGAFCDKCGERSAIIGVITYDGAPPKSEDDIVAQKLACGHTVGGKEYKKFLIDRQAIVDDLHAAIDSLQTSAGAKIAALRAAVIGAKKTVI